MASVWRRTETIQYCSLKNAEREFRSGVAVKASYVLLQLADLILTQLGTSLGFRELNPLISSVLASPVQLLAIKLVIPLFIAWLVPGRLLIPAIALLTGVVGWNLKELLVMWL